jgi:hypothetical protein
VDGAILAAWQSYSANAAHIGEVVEAQKAARAANLEQLNAARQAYLKRVEESVAYVRAQGLQGAAKVRAAPGPAPLYVFFETHAAAQPSGGASSCVQAAAETLSSKVEEARRVPEVLLHEIRWAFFLFVVAGRVWAGRGAVGTAAVT